MKCGGSSGKCGGNVYVTGISSRDGILKRDNGVAPQHTAKCRRRGGGRI